MRVTHRILQEAELRGREFQKQSRGLRIMQLDELRCHSLRSRTLAWMDEGRELCSRHVAFEEPIGYTGLKLRGEI